LATPNTRSNQLHAELAFDDWFVRFRYGPPVRSLSLRPSCSPRGLARPGEDSPGHPRLLLPGFQATGSPRMPAGYHYDAKLRIASAGLSPASTAASLAAPPPSVPPQAPSSGRPLPLRRVLWGEFPDLIGTYQPTPTSRLPSRLASFPSLGTTTASPSFAPPGPDDSPWAWTTSTAAPAPPLNGGEDEISQVPGRPLRTCPALRPRRTPDPRPLQDRRCGLPFT
jgi:hypothetical protein